MQIRFGADIFSGQAAHYRGKRFGLVTNEAAAILSPPPASSGKTGISSSGTQPSVSSGTPARQALLSAGHELIRLFSPEHGLERSGEDGREIPDGRDALTDLPIISLYGDKLEPDAADLADIDVLLFDLPDIGCRFYTYLWTLSHVMEACERHGKPLLVLDRPNPLSGNLDLAEGPMLDEERCASFIGRWSIPLRHSCTFGELARYWQAKRLPGLDLRVIGIEGWKRDSFHEDWGIPFVPTSPAMTNEEAALLYPGLGLLEATNLSEGRGTDAPFRMAGAPWLDNVSISALFNDLRLPGVSAEPVEYVPGPGAGKYQGEQCRGVRFHVNDPMSFRPVHTAMLFIRLVKDHHPRFFAWSPYPTHVNPTGAGHLDRLLGIPSAETFFEQAAAEFHRALPALLSCAGWTETMRPWLLY